MKKDLKTNYKQVSDCCNSYIFLKNVHTFCSNCLKQCDLTYVIRNEDGMKFDSEKPMYDLIDPTSLEALASVLTHGAKKYAPNNWKKVEPFNDRYYSALLRHLIAWKNGERNDTDSGLPHLWHAITNLHFLIWKDKQDFKK